MGKKISRKHSVTGRVLAVVILWAAVNPAAFAALGDVVQSFRAPREKPYALAADESNVYVYSGGLGPFYIWRLAASNGSIAGSFQVPGPYGAVYGLGYEYGGYLWFGNPEVLPPAHVIKLDAETGSFISSFPVYEHTLWGGVDCQGNPNVPGSLTAIITSDWNPFWFSRYTPAGSLLGSFRYDSTLVLRDIGWDYVDNLIWSPDSHGSDYVYGLTTRGSIVASFEAPDESPFGCAYVGGYLWLSTTPYGRDHYIWRVHCPTPNPAVAPASLGKVKALFR